MKRYASQTIILAMLLLAFGLSPWGKMQAQNLPNEMHLSPDGKRLVTGGNESTGYYDESVVHTIELFFDEANYWTLLTNNYQSGTDLGAVMVLDGDTLAAEVGVRFKGQTSYNQNQNSQKKSFNITLDFADPSQDVDGYETLNLNNCFEDPTFIREVLYLHQGRNHNQSLKGSYVNLYLNGQYWGPYANVQALDNKFIREWFLSSDGTRWRALKTIGGGGGPGGGGTGGPFGTGYSSLNWLGTSDTTEYKKYYTLKKTSKTNPWDDLVKVCNKLNNTPAAALEDTIKNYMDLDRTLWDLATENAYGDDDSYVNKGGMDYFLYWEPETGLMVPLEYDGNSVMESTTATWSPFFHANDANYALLNKLLAVPAIRQRYLAHLRTIIEDDLQQAEIDSLIDNYFEILDPLVTADTKKIYSYQEFVNGHNTLKTLFQTRRNTLTSNAEVNAQGLTIGSAVMASANGNWVSPSAGEVANITAQVSGAAGINRVNLYYATGLKGSFEKTQMFDDGAHSDGAANDGLFGAEIPGFGNGTYVRFYVEAIANNTAKTATYHPKGAEYDVFVYKIGVTEFFDSPVVVNEIMADNEAAVADQDGEFEDWIELYNNSADPVDLSGWYLSDNYSNLAKWAFPTGTTIAGNGYLIVWADEDGSQEGLHANFKLSASGETVYLLDSNLRIGQEIEFAQQETDKGFARIPNGTGDFVIKTQTFNANNESGVNGVNEDISSQKLLEIYPNPANGQVSVRSSSNLPVRLQAFNAIGQIVLERDIQGFAKLDISNWQSGIYWLKTGDATRKLVIE
ncbi:MAG: CotH kinase family protein [Saprospiraceae bacterium]|nr:CotH kinase family protein [Saprospiraceae bacterium]